MEQNENCEENEFIQKFQPYAANKSIFMFGLLIFTCDWHQNKQNKTEKKTRIKEKTPPAKGQTDNNKRCEDNNNNNNNSNNKKAEKTVANNKWVKFMKKQFLAAGHKY